MDYEYAGESEGDGSEGIDESMGESEGDGDVLGESDVLGALWRRRKRKGPQYPRSPRGERIYRQPPLPQTSAQPNRARLRSYMGMGFATWGPTDTGDKSLVVQPQESFRGGRLIIDLNISGGTSAGLVLLRSITIGTMPQSPSVEQPAPAAMFRADATYSSIDLQIAYRATQMQVSLGITAAPGSGVTVVAAVGFFGEWIR
jgi:hypothetical protein